MNGETLKGWELIEPAYRVEQTKAWEGLFTLGSGYLHLRGSFEEHLSDAPQNRSYTRMPANVTSETFAETKSKWGTYVPGVVGRHPLLGNEMINLPWFLGLAPVIDGERLDLELSEIQSYRRTLRLKDATLTRSLIWQTRSGKRVEIRFERFISAARPGLCLQQIRMQVDRPATVQFIAGIDADVRTNGFDHYASLQFDQRDESTCQCTLVTDGEDEIRFASGLKPVMPGSDHPIRYQQQGRRCELIIETTLEPDREWILEKRTAVTTSRDPQPRDPMADLQAADAQNWQQLHDEHADHWAQRWQTCDVVIEGDDESQLATRAALFHLLRAHVPDARVAIDAKGYAGEAYWGRYFWDTEMFLLPFYVYTDPDRARMLADFRVQSLEGARANAARYGYSGARYAWESDSSGIDCCPNWQYADHEVHVTADVAYGLVHYARASGDENYLQGPPAGVLVETARYWLERIDYRNDDDYPSLLGVMGPDEYTPISSNNSFTNMLVSEALRFAAEFGQYAKATESERSAFSKVAETLPLPRGKDTDLILQCEEFDQLGEPRFKTFWKDRTRTFGAQVSQERLYRIKALKQADVLMLMMLFPDRFSNEQVRRAWDYYLPYTTHDSSLSAGVHAIVARRLGLEQEAWDFWQQSRDIDLDVAHGGAAEGIHIANAGAIWQVLLFGFAGMQTAMQSERLSFSPRLPEAWSRLTFPLAWKGSRLQVEITRESCMITNQGPHPLAVRVDGQERELEPQTEQIWKLTP